MKYKIAFLVLFVATKVFSQSFDSKGKVEYTMSVFMSGPENFSGILYFGNDQSRFEFRLHQPDNKQDEVVQDEENNFKISIDLKDTTQNVIYMKRSENILYNQVKYNKKDVAVFEKLPALDWTISEEEKKIGSLVCTKAQMTFRGRNYTAWFAQSIPCFFGPWKLNGLPGLIIEAYDDKKEVYFSATKITVPHQAQVPFLDASIAKIDRSESAKIANQQIEELKKKLQASAGRDVKIQVGEIKMNKGIELD